MDMDTPDKSPRQLLTGVAAGAASPASARRVRARPGRQAAHGYWRWRGLPFFAAVERATSRSRPRRRALKFAGAQAVMEAMLSGAETQRQRTGSANLAIGEIAQPGLFKIFATKPSQREYVLEESSAQGQPGQELRDLKGKRVASGPGIQSDAGQTMLSRRRRHHRVTSCRSASTSRRSGRQVDAVYTRSPPGHRRRLNRHDGCSRRRWSRTTSSAPDGAMARRRASLTTEFIKVPGRDQRSTSPLCARHSSSGAHPARTRRASHKGYTAMKPLANEVPLASYMLYNEFKTSDVAYFRSSMTCSRQGHLREKSSSNR